MKILYLIFVFTVIFCSTIDLENSKQVKEIKEKLLKKVKVELEANKVGKYSFFDYSYKILKIALDKTLNVTVGFALTDNMTIENLPLLPYSKNDLSDFKEFLKSLTSDYESRFRKTNSIYSTVSEKFFNVYGFRSKQISDSGKRYSVYVIYKGKSKVKDEFNKKYKVCINENSVFKRCCELNDEIIDRAGRFIHSRLLDELKTIKIK